MLNNARLQSILFHDLEQEVRNRSTRRHRQSVEERRSRVVADGDAKVDGDGPKLTGILKKTSYTPPV